jgi:U4/U6.U5 tri-snRNP-associated protein 2
MQLVAETKTANSPFLMLAVDLPPPPIFQDAVEKNIIPQVAIQSVLAKFDGRTTQVGHAPEASARLG